MKHLRLIYVCVFGFFLLEHSFGQQMFSDGEYYTMQKDNNEIRKKSRFKFSRKFHGNRIDFNQIDTNSVYLFGYPSAEKKMDSIYKFYRFFKDAVFQSGPYVNSPTEIEFENLSYGVWRCYKMSRKGLLIIESPKRFEMDSRWIFYYGSIYTDRIELTHYYMSYPPIGTSPGRFQKPWVYYKKSVNFTNRLYSWED